MTEKKSKSSTLWEEIKRRKVVRVVVAYLLVGWGLIQIADGTLQPLHLPEWAGTLVVWLVALGFPITVTLAWVLDITPKGIKVTGPVEESDEVSSAPTDASIAVLPFVNMSGDPDNEYFSDGLSEELINLLTRLQSLRVCSRTSSFSLKGKNIDMPTIASQLGVRHVLEGSVRRAGDRPAYALAQSPASERPSSKGAPRRRASRADTEARPRDRQGMQAPGFGTVVAPK